MTAKEFLNRAYLLDQRIKSKSEQIQSLNELATKCTAVLSGMPHSPSHGSPRMAAAVCKIIDLENELAASVDELVQTKRETVEVINKVENAELRTLLEQRYLCGVTWERIAIGMNYSLRYVHCLHKKALKAVELLISEEAVKKY